MRGCKSPGKNMVSDPGETVTWKVSPDTVTHDVIFRILGLMGMNMEAGDHTAKDMYNWSLSLQILWSLWDDTRKK